MAATEQLIDDVLRGRRTVHAFRPEIPDRQLILAALETACWAPNHHVTEPWRFHWLGPKAVATVIELNARIVTAKKGEAAGEAKRRQWSTVPGWLVVTMPRPTDAAQETEDFAAVCCAVQNFMLSLWSRGIGSKWTTGSVTRDPEFFRLLALAPEENRVVGMIWYGYPAEVPTQSRRSLSDVLSELD